MMEDIFLCYFDSVPCLDVHQYVSGYSRILRHTSYECRVFNLNRLVLTHVSLLLTLLVVLTKVFTLIVFSFKYVSFDPLFTVYYKLSVVIVLVTPVLSRRQSSALTAIRQ